MVFSVLPAPLIPVECVFSFKNKFSSLFTFRFFTLPYDWVMLLSKCPWPEHAEGCFSTGPSDGHGNGKGARLRESGFHSNFISQAWIKTRVAAAFVLDGNNLNTFCQSSAHPFCLELYVPNVLNPGTNLNSYFLPMLLSTK